MAASLPTLRMIESHMGVVPRESWMAGIAHPVSPSEAGQSPLRKGFLAAPIHLFHVPKEACPFKPTLHSASYVWSFAHERWACRAVSDILRVDLISLKAAVISPGQSPREEIGAKAEKKQQEFRKSVLGTSVLLELTCPP